jgi:drug/metabolite transporter (DMT)-like permease
MQALLLEDSEKLSSLSLLGHMAPISAVVLIPLTVFYEPTSAHACTKLVQSSWLFATMLALNCLLAFFVNLTNFLVTKHCGALTLQVLGNAKGVIAAVISVFVFHNPVTFLGWLGFGITMCGVVAYSESRKRSERRAHEHGYESPEAPRAQASDSTIWAGTGAGFAVERRGTKV